MNEYETYLGHFFDGCQEEIRKERPELLREKLHSTEELIQDLIEARSQLSDDSTLWEYIFQEYITLHKRSLEQDNVDLRNEVVASFYGVVSHTNYEDEYSLFSQASEKFGSFFGQALPATEYDEGIEFLIKQLKHIRNIVTGQFESAEDEEELEQAEALVEKLLRQYAHFLKMAVECQSIKSLDHLRHHLTELRAFEEYRYQVHHPNPTEDSQVDPEFREKKQERANALRRRKEQVLFAGYAWAFHLSDDEDSSREFVRTIFADYVEADFPRVSALSKTYFELCEEPPLLDFFESWNMQRELEKNYGGVTTTGMAVDTWLLEFYAVALIWVTGQEESNRIDPSSPEQSPISEFKRVQHLISKVTDAIESSCEDYVFSDLLESDPSTEERCELLIDYFQSLSDYQNEREQEWIQNQPIYEQAVDHLASSIDSRLDSCGLRNAIDVVGEIQQRDLNEETDVFQISTTSLRKPFVDDGTSTYYQSSFQWLIDQYREIILDNLNFEQKVTKAVQSLPDQLAELSDSNDVAILVVDELEALDALEDDERVTRKSRQDIDSYLELNGIPIITDMTTAYSAVAIFDSSFEYIETNEEYPISVSVTPGEEVFTQDDVPSDADVRDYVQVDFSYSAKIRSENQNGVVFRPSQG
ncbi:hypothetical protein [Halorubrum persicum]|uniref:hypothetical protein n=1 Tax=Halorubrum persicum TaxID=1383844 RepID=UPI0011818015|nr:hypothetical protein [Halorubrum persicum]